MRGTQRTFARGAGEAWTESASRAEMIAFKSIAGGWITRADVGRECG